MRSLRKILFVLLFSCMAFVARSQTTNIYTEINNLYEVYVGYVEAGNFRLADQVQRQLVRSLALLDLYTTSLLEGEADSAAYAKGQLDTLYNIFFDPLDISVGGSVDTTYNGTTSIATDYRLDTVKVNIRSEIYSLSLDTITGDIDTVQVNGLETFVENRIIGAGGVTANQIGDTADVVRAYANERISDSITNFKTKANFFNGSIDQNHTISVYSDGTDIYLKLISDNDSIGLEFDGMPYYFQVPDSVILTEGTNDVPARSWVYIPKSTKTLTVNSSFPMDEQFMPIADVLVGSAERAQSIGAYKVHAWTDHLIDNVNQGHLSHINKWIRNQSATIDNSNVGLVTTVEVGTNASSLDTIKLSITSGSILQLHRHTFPAKNLMAGDTAFLINGTTSYDLVTDLATIDTDTEESSLRNNNDAYSIVVWGSVGEDSTSSHIFLNRPSGHYSYSTDWDLDPNNYAVYTIPIEYKGTGFLIARINIRYQTADNGTFTITSITDLRGLIPSVAAGGSSLVSSYSVPDNLYEIHNSSDVTKKVKFNVSNVSTETTRTLTIPDITDTIAVKSNIENSFGSINDIQINDGSGGFSNANGILTGSVFTFDGEVFDIETGSNYFLTNTEENAGRIQFYVSNGGNSISLQHDYNHHSIVNTGTNSFSFDLSNTGLVIDKGIRIANTILENPGAMRWTGSDFEGYNGSSWLSLTSGGGISNIVEDLTPQLGGNLDIQSYNIEGVDATEFGYVDGVTSDIQAQLNGKVNDTGNETIAGIKTFSWNIYADSSIRVSDTTISGFFKTSETIEDTFAVTVYPGGVFQYDTLVPVASWMFDQKLDIFDKEYEEVMQKKELPLMWMDEKDGTIYIPYKLEKPWSKADVQILGEVEKLYMRLYKTQKELNELKNQLSIYKRPQFLLGVIIFLGISNILFIIFFLLRIKKTK